MRPTCLDCCRKHLCQASILLEEYATGDYDVHFWYAIGHMAEAESESMKEYPELAAVIREERIKMIDDAAYFTDFEPIIQAATILAEKEEGEKEDAAEQESNKILHQEETERAETGLGSNAG